MESNNQYILIINKMFQRLLITRITYNFVRNIKKAPNPISAKSQLQQLHDQFQPLSPSPPVQQHIKQQVAKSLSYQGEDPTPHKLVNRPSKGVVWGLGGELIVAQKKIELEGIKAQIDEVISFLELHQVKNIYVHDWSLEEDSTINRRRYSIIGSCFSGRHCWKTGIELKNGFNKNRIQKKNSKYDPIQALLIGRKDQEWMMVEYKDFQVSLMTEEQREAVDLQWKWNNPVSQQKIEKYMDACQKRKGHRGQFEDFE